MVFNVIYPSVNFSSSDEPGGFICIPDSHFSPCQPGLQMHVNVACPSLQLRYPSSLHGRGLHWSGIAEGNRRLLISISIHNEIK